MVGGDNDPAGIPCATIVRIRRVGAREHGSGVVEIPLARKFKDFCDWHEYCCNIIMYHDAGNS
jgi:hypothetical protein